MTSIAKFFQDGGSIMYVNLFVFVFALAVVAERLVVLTSRLRLDEKKFLEAVENSVMGGNVDRAVKLCTINDGAAAATVVHAALNQARGGANAVAAAIDESLMEVKPRIQKRAGILFGIANLATLIGLVGTVFGLIEAFAAIGEAAPDQKSVLLTKGIAHAMNNTAFGLSIAVTCIFFHMIVSGLVRGLLGSVDHTAIRIENILARRRSEEEGREAAKSAPAAS